MRRRSRTFNSLKWWYSLTPEKSRAIYPRGLVSKSLKPYFLSTFLENRAKGICGVSMKITFLGKRGMKDNFSYFIILQTDQLFTILLFFFSTITSFKKCGASILQMFISNLKLCFYIQTAVEYTYLNSPSP